MTKAVELHAIKMRIRSYDHRLAKAVASRWSSRWWKFREILAAKEADESRLRELKKRGKRK